MTRLPDHAWLHGAAFSLALGALSTLALGCSAADDPTALSGFEPGTGGGGTSGATATAGSGGDATATAGSAGNDVNPLGRARCRAPQGVSDAPQNTDAAIQLLNALPKPTSVACFVESLARPLTAYATSSAFSAQPALSTTSPRVFIKLGQLWISVVIDGKSSYLLEFGELVASDPTRSIKGELQLPMADVVTPSAPYDRVRYNEGTVCGLCHYAEQRAENLPFTAAFSSIAFRPRPDTRVSIDLLQGAHQSCDWQLEPHRCEMLSAVFGGGTVQETAFPDSMATFF